MFPVELTFCGDLPVFLRKAEREATVVRRDLGEKTSVKDVIEACGVPHTEVDLIVLREESRAASETVDFGFQIASSAKLSVYPAPAPPDVLPLAPRLQSRSCVCFVADGHLAALARHLRLLGIDTACEPDPEDWRLLEIMVAEKRALLTRDRRLLMHSIVKNGYCPRSDDPEEQVREVLRRFDLTASPKRLAPLSRCLRCNGLLRSVPKGEVLAELADEPRTLRYYDDFLRCSDCGRIYWRGSHFEKLITRLARLGGMPG